MSVRTQAFKCIYCEDLFKSRTIADRHELTCLKNPKCKNCYVCQYMKEGVDSNLLCSIDNSAIGAKSKLKAIKCTNFKRKV